MLFFFEFRDNCIFHFINRVFASMFFVNLNGAEKIRLRKAFYFFAELFVNFIQLDFCFLFADCLRRFLLGMRSGA